MSETVYMKQKRQPRDEVLFYEEIRQWVDEGKHVRVFRDRKGMLCAEVRSLHKAAHLQARNA